MKKSEIKDLYNQSNSALSLLKMAVMLLPLVKEDVAVDRTLKAAAVAERLFHPVKAMCDYMIDDGSIDMSEHLKNIKSEVSQIEQQAAKMDKIEESSVLMQNCRAIINTIKDVEKWTANGVEPQHKAPEALQQPNEGNNGELAGNGNEAQPEPTAKPIVEIVKEQLPTIYDDEEMKNLEQRVFYNAINKKYMVLRDDEKAYIWKENKQLNLLAYMCGRLYCDDKVVQRQDRYGKYHKKVIKGGRMKKASSIKDLFNGIDIANNRYQLLRNENVPEGYRLIDNLFEQEKNSEKMAGQ